MPRAFLVKSTSRPAAHQPYVRPWTDQDANDENNNSENIDNLNCRISAMTENRIPLPLADDLRHREVKVTSSSPLAARDSTSSRLDHLTPSTFRRTWKTRRPLEGLSTNVESLSGIMCGGGSGLEAVTPVAIQTAVRHSGLLITNYFFFIQ